MSLAPENAWPEGRNQAERSLINMNSSNLEAGQGVSNADRTLHAHRGLCVWQSLG